MSSCLFLFWFKVILFSSAKSVYSGAESSSGFSSDHWKQRLLLSSESLPEPGWSLSGHTALDLHRRPSEEHGQSLTMNGPENTVLTDVMCWESGGFQIKIFFCLWNIDILNQSMSWTSQTVSLDICKIFGKTRVCVCAGAARLSVCDRCQGLCWGQSGIMGGTWAREPAVESQRGWKHQLAFKPQLGAGPQR